MKKLLLGLIIIISLVSCETVGVYEIDNQYVINGVHLETYIIEDCEYIGFVHMSNMNFLTHKGNCHNPIHKCK